MRIAFHTYILVVGIGSFRGGSVLNLPYKQVRFALVQDPASPASTKLVAHVLIIHNKRQKLIRRSQDDKIEFTVTFMPGRPFCLLSLLAARALADDAFAAGYQSFNELLNRPIMEPGSDYLPLPLKDNVLDKRAIPLTQKKMNEVWNRTVLISGVRKKLKAYSLRVGAGGRLNGT
ncbi:hypothetical protein GGR54DRAFT_642931 [Hypoxylon sp. NC1633]|nr:hypothetical protein GGR54DRAFT_642931 [Hypoxylon sp. NC1633]